MIEPCDITQLADVAAVAMQAWELCHTGMNGLRFGKFEESKNEIESVSIEMCSANEEDLSSFEQYLGAAQYSHAARRSYWFTRVFNNCSTICVSLQTTFDVLKASIKGHTLNHDGLSFKLDSVEMKGYSVLKREGFESCTLTDLDMVRHPEGFHSEGEGHNHVILTIKTQDDKEHVLDLSGPQFGNFGPNPLQPYLCVEPIEVWMTRFYKVTPAKKIMSYSAKINMVKDISSIVCKAYFVRNATKQPRAAKAIAKVEEGAEERARLAEIELMAMLQKEEPVGK